MLRFAKSLPRWIAFGALAAVVASTALLWADQPTLAQGGPGRPPIDVQAFNACTTTDYTTIAAKDLNLTPVALRTDIVKGQNLQQIAADTKADLQKIASDVQAARKTDIDQAVKDGVMTQDEATALETPVNTAATRPAPSGTRPANGRGGQGAFNPANVFPDISTIGFLLRQGAATQAAPGNGNGGNGGFAGPGGFGGGFGGFGLGAGTFNMVKQYQVAADALKMKCPDLVKTLITPPGKSISALAQAANIDPKTVSAALVKAYQDALTQDVSDGVITQADSDQLSKNLGTAADAFVGNPLPMGQQQGTPAAPVGQ